MNKLNKNLLRIAAVATAIATTTTLTATIVCIGVGFAIAEGAYIISEKLDAIVK